MQPELLHQAMFLAVSHCILDVVPEVVGHIPRAVNDPWKKICEHACNYKWCWIHVYIYIYICMLSKKIRISGYRSVVKSDIRSSGATTDINKLHDMIDAQLMFQQSGRLKNVKYTSVSLG